MSQHPIEKLWREVGLPEWFLGNGGTNTKLYELYDRIWGGAERPPCPRCSAPYKPGAAERYWEARWRDEAARPSCHAIEGEKQ